MNGVNLDAHGIKEIRIAAANKRLPNLLKIFVMDNDNNISCINLFFKGKINLGIDDSGDFRVNHLPTLTVCGDKEIRGETIDWQSESRGEYDESTLRVKESEDEEE